MRGEGLFGGGRIGGKVRGDWVGIEQEGWLVDVLKGRLRGSCEGVYVRSRVSHR